MKDDFQYYQGTPDCRRITQQNGVRTTTSLNRFEMVVDPGTEVWEQLAAQAIKEWVRWRKEQEELRQPGGVPE